MKVKLSGVIITYNEEQNLERCILSLQGIADEIVVLDSFSSDQTEEICKKYGVRFIQHRFDGHVEQKNRAVENASSDYVLSLDADEEISPRLKESILTVKENWEDDGYSFNRLNSFCGTWIRHSGWYPDRKLRLWDRRRGRWGGLNPHDRVIMDKGSSIRFISGNLNHYSYSTREEFVERTAKYAKIGAESLFRQGKQPSPVKLIFSPAWRFIKHYIIGMGMLDGVNGLVISWHQARGTYVKYRELYRICSLKNNSK